uniref:Uncharacterized protein n=1 Tax=Anopheles albimanus TaxID=7167 RepID=A0A182FV21_ANOAL
MPPGRRPRKAFPLVRPLRSPGKNKRKKASRGAKKPSTAHHRCRVGGHRASIWSPVVLYCYTLADTIAIITR